MFNSPALDTAIGLIFIFLLYSLLATSIQEAIATAFGMRAAMLKKCIVRNMLSDAPRGSRFKNLGRNIKSSLLRIPRLIGIHTKITYASLGEKFYDHPLIKNYGESRIFPLPSYIPQSNFSAVLVDILKRDFDNNIMEIAEHKQSQGTSGEIGDIRQELLYLEDTYKIKEVLRYHIYCYGAIKEHQYYIHCDTCRILDMHLHNSQYDVTVFRRKLEEWFTDSMHRVTGWYKRQAQLMLFLIGITFAFMFNVDTLQIAGKLSTDKDARDKLVAMAIAVGEKYKDDPRVQRLSTEAAAGDRDAADSLNAIRDEYDNHIEEAKKTLNNDLKDANELLALGWNGFGRKDSAYVASLRNKYGNEISYDAICNSIDEPDMAKKDAFAAEKFFLKAKEKHPVKVRAGYVAQKLGNNPRSLLGYLILAFGICLGAPFWFDLLNKLVSLRGSGKKEGSEKPAIVAGTPQQPLTITVNQGGDDEAVG